MFFLFAYITYNVQFMETVPSTLTCLLYYRTFSPSSWHGYRFFSSSQDCMKERMSDPMSTVRSTISIVLNVLRFCCMLVFFLFILPRVLCLAHNDTSGGNAGLPRRGNPLPVAGSNAP